MTTPSPAPAPQPLVSVVIPVFDAEDFIAAAVASVQAQRWQAWELLLIDDGSQDGSAAVMQRLAAADPRIRLLQTAGQKGAGVARNQGIQAAKGRFVAFLDADDLWHPDKLARQIPAMLASGTGLSCTGYLRRNLATGREVVVGVPPRITRRMMLRTNLIACSTAVFDREICGPQQMPELRRRQDYAFWLALMTEGREALGLPLVLMTYQQRAVSVSSSKLRAAASTWAMYRQTVGLSVPETLGSFFHYSLRGLARHRAPGLARRLGWLHSADAPAPLAGPLP